MDFAERLAVLRIRDLPVLDAFTVPNSLDGGTDIGPPVPATVSLELIWGFPTRTVNDFSNTANHFRGTFVECHASLAGVAKTPSQNFELVIDPSSIVTGSAQIGRERNGFFFDHPCHRDDRDVG